MLAFTFLPLDGDSLWIAVLNLSLRCELIHLFLGEEEGDEEEAGSYDKMEDLDSFSEMKSISHEFKKDNQDLSSMNQVPGRNQQQQQQ